MWSDAAWLLSLGQKRPCSFCQVLLECSLSGDPHTNPQNPAALPWEAQTIHRYSSHSMPSLWEILVHVSSMWMKKFWWFQPSHQMCHSWLFTSFSLSTQALWSRDKPSLLYPIHIISQVKGLLFYTTKFEVVCDAAVIIRMDLVTWKWMLP